MSDPSENSELPKKYMASMGSEKGPYAFLTRDHDDPMTVLQQYYETSLHEPSLEVRSNYFWQAAGSVFSLIASPIGLIGNLSSLIALADKWRMYKDGTTVSDQAWLMVLNSLALACGCLANMLLFLSFNQIIPPRTRHIPMIAYFLATVIYMAMIGAAEHVYFDHSPYYRTQGYWQGAIASCCYFISTVLLFVNSIGRWLHQYDHDLNVSPRQRRIMILMTLFIAWIGMGGAVAQKLLNINFADGVYFCLVSCSTLGYGDILANTNLSRALLIPYIYVGVVLMGLTAIIIYQAILRSSRKSAIEFAVVKRRRLEYAKLKDEPSLTGEIAFNTMRSIVAREQVISEWLYFLATMGWLLSFWLIGALVFSYTEQWGYWDAFYFCSISLAAVGYGDFVPTSVGGRAFFTIWCFMAPPTMAAAISDLTNISFNGLDSLLETLSGRFLMKQIEDIPPSVLEVFCDNYSEGQNNYRENAKLVRIVAMMLLQKESTESYPFEIWNWAIEVLFNDKMESGKIDPAFWLSDESPIRFLINERKCLLLICMHVLHANSSLVQALMSMKRNESLVVSEHERSELESLVERRELKYRQHRRRLSI